jgi:hypothetical protein
MPQGGRMPTAAPVLDCFLADRAAANRLVTQAQWLRVGPRDLW